MAESVVLAFDEESALAGLDRLLATVQDEGTLRTGGQAMAQVFYDEARLRAPVAKTPKRLKGGRFSVPGTLQRSIYQVYSKDNSPEGVATYHVSWNRKKAPHGDLVEFGTSRAPAHPFLRPAYETRKVEAVEAGLAAIRRRLEDPAA